MDVLRDWLAPTIQYELSQALQWKETAPNVEQTVGKEAGYSDDGSNLRVQSSKDGVVQVSKFLTFTPPIQAILSDKTTRISARISSSATREYQDKFRYPFTKDTTGGLIQILEFEIVATHLGPRSDRLTLLVNKFRSLGSNGSGAFSVPRPIESPDKGCSALLDKLIDIRAHEKTTSSRDRSTRESSAAASPIHSQIGLVCNDSGAAFESQTMFATQVPLTTESHPIRHQNSIAYFSSHEGVRDSSNIYECPSDVMDMMRRPVNVPTNFLESEATHIAKATAESSTNPSGLVCAINQKNGMNIHVDENLGGSKEESFVKEAKVAQNLQDKFGNEALQLVKESGQLDVDQTFSFSPSAGAENHLESSVVNLNLSTGPQSSNRHILDETSTHPAFQERSAEKRKLDDRIRSRDLRISKDQEGLLSRPDSWLPADPNQREPRANVPIALLDTFNRYADLNADCKPKDVSDQPEAPANGLVTFGVDEVPDGKVSISPTESDIDSEQWPPSPTRDQLPPDSTPPASVHSGRQIDVSEPLDSQANPSLFASIHLKAGTRNSFQDSLDQSILNDQGPLAGTTNQEPLWSLIDHSLPHYSVNGLNQNLTQQFNGRTNEPSFPSETIVKSQLNRKSPSLEASRPGCSTPDSDIEMTVPMPLHKTIQSPSHVTLQESLPSTAAQAKQPFTQVKRTPHPPDNTHKSPTRAFFSKSRPNGVQEYENPRGTFEQSDVSIPSTAPKFVSKSDGFSLSSLQTESKDSILHGTELRGRSVERNSISTRPVAGIGTSGPNEEGDLLSSQANDDNCNFASLRLEQSNNSSKLANRAPKDSSPELSSQILLSGKRVFQADEATADGRCYSKRGKTKSSFFHRKGSSRRGKMPIPPSLNISDIPDDLPDPAISARQHREDWFAARRSSESSATRESPISPFTGHAISASSVEGRSTRSNSIFAMPTLHEGNKTTQEVAKTDDASTSIHEKEPAVYDPDPPQRAAPEQLRKKNLTPSFVSESIQILHDATQSPASKTFTNQGVIDAYQVPQPEEGKPNARLTSNPTKPPRSLQSTISHVEAPLCRRELISPDIDSHFLRSPTRSAEPGRSEAAVDQQLPNGSTPLVPDKAKQMETVLPSQFSFKEFKIAYPDYSGDMKHFLALCKKIEKLWKQNSLHRSMWDDFLIRNKTDYATYIKRCLEDGDDPMPYERFYNDQIDEPKYRKKVLTMQSLEGINNNGSDRRNAASRDVSAVNTPTTVAFQSVKPNSENKTSPSSGLTQKAIRLIDLTDDDHREATPTKKGPLTRSEFHVHSSSHEQGLGIANGKSHISQTPDVSLCPIMPPSQPTILDFHGALQSATYVMNPLKRTDAGYGRAEYFHQSPIKKLEMPLMIQNEQILAERRGTNGGTGLDAALSMPEKAPLKSPSADARLEGQDQSRHPLWWQDDNTPFKTFVRSYLAIRPGNGNAFAKPEDIAKGQKYHEDKMRKLRHLDVLGLNLESKH